VSLSVGISVADGRPVNPPFTCRGAEARSPSRRLSGLRSQRHRPACLTSPMLREWRITLFPDGYRGGLWHLHNCDAWTMEMRLM